MYFGEASLRSNAAGDSRIFGTNGYTTVSWNCRVVESKMTKEMKFKDRIEKIAASISTLDPGHWQ
jgi:hypothetical protein